MGEALSIINILQLLIEVVEETIGFERMRDHTHSLAMLIDLLLDNGTPFFPEKSLLIALLQQPSSAFALLSKA